MSTIKVDTIQKANGTSQIGIDKIGGVTSASIVNVIAEGGSTTTNLSQGLAKMWVAAETDAQPFDSFNTASGTDNGTGDYTYAFTNVMSNDDYSITSGCSYAALLSFDHPERTASNYNVRIFSRADSLTNDNAKNNQAIHGDLA
mgnify:CR=1 FL=1